MLSILGNVRVFFTVGYKFFVLQWRIIEMVRRNRNILGYYYCMAQDVGLLYQAVASAPGLVVVDISQWR